MNGMSVIAYHIDDKIYPEFIVGNKEICYTVAD